jgi:hypothetical protein
MSYMNSSGGPSKTQMISSPVAINTDQKKSKILNIILVSGTGNNFGNNSALYRDMFRHQRSSNTAGSNSSALLGTSVTKKKKSSRNENTKRLNCKQQISNNLAILAQSLSKGTFNYIAKNDS